jgi:membrane-bound lytic murein transglycosylase F
MIRFKGTTHSVILYSLVLFFSCNSKPGQEKKTIQPVVSTTTDTLVIHDWDAIKAKGRLRAILKNSPTGYFLYKGRPMGFEYELLNRFCTSQGLLLEVILESDVEKCFQKLGDGSCDIIAHNLTITKERRKTAEFTDPQYSVRQMLVQRLPDNFQKLKQHELERKLIRDPLDLIGKEIHVRKNSSYVQRLKNLSGEMGGNIKIIEEFGDIQTEVLIDMVARKDIDYTMADEDIARITATYYHNLDVNTPLSFPTLIAWAVNKNSPGLLNELNEWIRTVKTLPDYNVIYNRYFNDPKGYLARVKSDYSSIRGKKVSPYDALIKKYAKRINWDWRLLAALIYRESHFDPGAESWAGAQGLMQLMPETAKLYNTKNIRNPEENIRAGTAYITAIDDLLKNQVKDENERLKFILASFNVGQGHVEDAIKLASKYRRDPAKWEDNVEYYLLRKSEPAYYEDPVSTSGYCRGEEPVNYVREILKQFDIYKQLLRK